MNENDVVLESVIYTIDKVDALEMDITLNVKGMVITGLLVSKSAYLKGSASTFEGKGEVGDVLSDMFLNLVEFQKDALGEEHTKITDDEDKSVYGVHLKNAQIIDGESIHNVGYWRGKLSSVDGFNFGQLVRRQN